MDGTCFAQHREKLINIIRQDLEVTEGIIFYQSPEQLQEPFSNSDLPFFQEALFYWLSGWDDPESAITIDISNGHTILYIKPYDEHYEIWSGPVPTTESIIEQTGVDEVKTKDQYINDIIFHIKKKTPLFGSTVQNTLKIPCNTNVLPQAAGMARVVKFPHEISLLRSASKKTGQALVESIKRCKPGIYEYEFESMFLNFGTRLGCRNPSFQTIVGSGQHSVYLHYMSNSGVISDGDLVLVDCGLFDKHYAGDITRTFPANGKFSPDQKLVYNLLLEKQIELINSVKPGVTFTDLNNKMRECIVSILAALGIVPDGITSTDKVTKIGYFFCPHGLTHNVGCNVHDMTYVTLPSNSWKPFSLVRPGMVITIEPGIYFHEVRLQKERENPEYSCVDFEKALHYARTVGGIRIEDDILVTEEGIEVLSKECPKTVEEIESLMAGN